MHYHHSSVFTVDKLIDCRNVISTFDIESRSNSISLGEDGSLGMGAEWMVEQWWEWAKGADPVAAATWGGTIISAVGFVITICGFYTAIKEAKAAKQQASAAATAVERLKSSLSSGSLAYTHSQISMLLQFVDGHHHYPAKVLLATIRRETLSHAAVIQASPNTIEDLKRRMKIVSNQINWAQDKDQRFNAVTLQNALTGVQDTIVGWENTLRQKAGEVPK